MKTNIRTLFLSFLILGLITAFAQEDGESFEDTFLNPNYTIGTSGFEFDGQAIEGSDWEWLHPTPNGNTLTWVQVIDANTWYMAGFGGTFMKTTDGGSTFTVYHNVGGQTTGGIYKTIYDGHFFDANTGVICGASGLLLRTTDAGATWDSVGVGVSSTIYSMYFLNSTVGFITGTTTIDVWKTTDAGLTWNALAGGILGTAYEIYAIDEDTLFYGSTTGDLGRSNDGGATWIEVDIGISESIREIEFSSMTNGWAVGDDGAASYTTDAGLTWTLANTGLPATSDFEDVEIMGAPPEAVEIVYPQSAILWTGSTDGVVKTDSSEVIGQNTEDGWFTFDISSIPDGSTIDSIIFYGYVNATNWPYWSLTTLGGLDPLTASASALKDTIQANSGSSVAYLYRNESSSFATGWKSYLVGGTVNADFEAALSQDWFAMGMDSRDNSSTYYLRWDGWNEANVPYLEVYYTPPSGAETVYLTGDPFAIYSSTDMGTTWTPFSHLDPSQAWTGEFYTTSFYNGSALTVGQNGMINGWSTPPIEAGTAYNTWLAAGTFYDIVVLANDAVIAGGQPGISGVTFDQVVYSTDFGETWGVATFSDSMTQDVNDIGMADNSIGYLCGDEGRVYKTTDGGMSWTFVSAPTSLELEEIIFFDEFNGYTFGDDGAAFKTTDGGSTWSTLTTGFGTADIWTASFLNQSVGYIAGSSGNLEYTTDGGTTFTPLNPDMGTSIIYTIEMLDANNGFLCGASGKVRKTTDGGATWTTIDPGLSTGSIYDMDFYDPLYGVLAQSSGRTYYTNDGGTSWFFENTGASSLYGVDLRNTSPDTAAVFITGSLAYIQRNMDVIVPVELSGFTATVTGNTVTLDWTTATELNNLGFYVERQESEQWTEIGFVEGSGTTTETQEYRFVDKNVPAGTYYYRIKQVDFDGSVKYYEHQQAVEVGAPASYDLSQNYPNPFNPSTKIKYSVPADGFVNIAVYNVLGEKVVDIVNSLQKAGSYEVDFDATKLSSGMYLYRMEAGDFVSVKKMMILK